MRRTRVTLEQEVIRAAREVLDATPAEIRAGREPVPAVYRLAGSMDALDAHLDDLKASPGKAVHGAPWTSHTTASLSTLTQGSARRAIVDELRSLQGTHLGRELLGLTDDELEARLHRPHTTVSSARNWLGEAGWIEDTTFTRPTRAGRPAVIWNLTTAAWRHLAEQVAS